MAPGSRGSLFRTRNFLGAALLAGVGLGVYLGKFNFGLGGGNQFGIGSSDSQTHVTTAAGNIKPLEVTSEKKEKVESPIAVPDVVRILIDERQYYLRSENGGDQDVAMELPKLIRLIEQAPGDSDGLRVRVYLKSTARASAEENLKSALKDAGINEASVFWVPTPVK
jgi:hypothetical protein